jgi:S1-C subfamily serine protease
VQSVSPSGAAAAEGVKANDRVLSLNGVDATTITENEIAVPRVRRFVVDFG